MYVKDISPPLHVRVRARAVYVVVNVILIIYSLLDTLI
jgi:hypothetical protein